MDQRVKVNPPYASLAFIRNQKLDHHNASVRKPRSSQAIPQYFGGLTVALEQAKF
jgi:hypothetical protein